MNPIGVLTIGALCGYLAGNPPARAATFAQLQKLSGMAIDSLNKQGGNNVQYNTTPPEEPEQSDDQS